MTGFLIKQGIVVGFALSAWVLLWVALPSGSTNHRTVTTDISATLFKRD